MTTPSPGPPPAYAGLRATLSPKGERVRNQVVLPLAPLGERGGGEGITAIPKPHGYTPEPANASRAAMSRSTIGIPLGHADSHFLQKRQA